MAVITENTTRKKSTSSGRYWPYLIPGLVAFVLIVVIPFVWNIYLSFTKWNGLGTPQWIGLENYAKLMVDDTFWQSFLHSIVFIFAMAIIPTILGLVIASALFDYAVSYTHLTLPTKRIV